MCIVVGVHVSLRVVFVIREKLLRGEVVLKICVQDGFSGVYIGYYFNFRGRFCFGHLCYVVV